MPIFRKKKKIGLGTPQPISWIPPTNERVGHRPALPAQQSGKRFWSFLGIKGGSGLDVSTEIQPIIDITPHIVDQGELEHSDIPFTVTTLTPQHGISVLPGEVWQIHRVAAQSDGLAADQLLSIQLAVIAPNGNVYPIVQTEAFSTVTSFATPSLFRVGQGAVFYPPLTLFPGWSIGFIRQKFTPGASASIVVTISLFFKRGKNV